MEIHATLPPTQTRFPEEQEAVQEQALPEGFAYLDEAIEQVLWDARYAKADNFTGAIVDGYEADRVVLSKEMVQPLTVARDLARAEGYGLLVWDAARPQRAVDCFVAWTKAPEDMRTKDAHYPHVDKTDLFRLGYIAARSGHSRGAAIDLTLTDAHGTPLDMGGTFDFMDDRSHHGAKGLTKEQTQNRKTLKRIMQKAGFRAYSAEWWHYILKREPYPDTYFDFVICAKDGEE